MRTATRPRRYRRLAAFVLVVGLGAASAVVGHPAGAAPAVPPYLADANDPAVTSLAKDSGLSIDEARRRIGWQHPASEMGEELQRELGERFGGMWLHEAGGGRVKVGIVGGTTSAAAAQTRATARRWQLGAVTDVVAVQTSFAQLVRDITWLAPAIHAANPPERARLSTAIQVSNNRVVLRVPSGTALSTAQHATVEAASQRLGARLTLETWSGRVDRQACGWLERFNCDPPLRGGVKTYLAGERPQCTTAFFARSRSDGKPYMMTAGHCGIEGTHMYAYQPRTGIHHHIGPVHNSVGYPGPVAPDWNDFAIISINNADGWNPRNIVFVHESSDTVRDPEYAITGTSTTDEGTRVCISGATSGTDCGPAVEVYWEGRPGLIRAQYCSDPGDSGSPIYSNHLARGIHHGVVRGTTGCRNALFQAVREAAAALNVNVVTR
jgi:hypothetical protein